MMAALDDNKEKFQEFRQCSMDLVNDKITPQQYVKIFFKTFRKQDAVSLFPGFY